MKCMVLVLALVLTSCATKSNVVENQPQAASPTTAQSTTAPVASPVPMKKVENTPLAGELTCKMGEHIRSVKIVKPESGGCEVMYTKDGQTNSIASARNDVSHCDKVRDQIKSNLTAFGYTCQ